MKIQITHESDTIVTTLSGKLNSDTAPQLEERLTLLTKPPQGHLIIDCGELDYISSAGLRVVLALSRQYTPSDWALCMCCLQEHVLEVFEMSGFDNFVAIENDLDGARQTIYA